MYAGNNIEYIKKINDDGTVNAGTYIVIATGVNMMNPETGKWMEAVVYGNAHKGLGDDWSVMELKEFYKTFKNLGEDLEEETNGNDTDLTDYMGGGCSCHSLYCVRHIQAEQMPGMRRNDAGRI